MNGGSVNAIVIFYALISDIHITNNIFKNLIADGHVTAIYVGSNRDLDTTRDIFISGNYMDTIIGSTEVIDGHGHEVHGILAYGTNLNILNNTVKNLNAGQDHEAIYIKGRDSIIANNVVVNCGSGGGGADIASKGEELTGNNTISGNIIIGDQPGRGILVGEMSLNGGTIVKNNYIKKTRGSNGIGCYAFGGKFIITNNTVETKRGSAVYLEDAPNSVIRDNSLISYDYITIKIEDSSGTQISGNTECTGYNCPSAPEPVALPAFPGAEGYGANTIGGRGGRVIEVTNLNAEGPGSFREAVEASGPRIVVFRVGGMIDITDKIVIRNPFITIAGQTTPGDGISIGGGSYLVILTHDVIVRGLRVRVGDNPDGPRPGGRDGIQIYGSNVIIDHCSVSWAIDENFSLKRFCHDITIPGITTHPATEAYDLVLDNAGAIAPRRDAVDKRVIQSVRDNTGSIIDSQDDVGGWPTYARGTAPVDSDHDGMPDDWEKSHGLNPNDLSDSSGVDIDTRGYTNIEVYINGLFTLR